MNIYAVRTANFTDILYYAKWSDARDFTNDQRKMGFRTSVKKQQVSASEFAYLMATMNMPDGQGGVKF